jgi:hypothetical protein
MGHCEENKINNTSLPAKAIDLRNKTFSPIRARCLLFTAAAQLWRLPSDFWTPVRMRSVLDRGCFIGPPAPLGTSGALCISLWGL